MKASSSQPDVEALGRVVEALDPLDEKQRVWVLQTAASRYALQVDLGSSQNGGAGGHLSPKAGNQTAAAGGTPTPKAFMKTKNPQTDVQRVACLGAYLTGFRSTPHFKTKVLTDLNTEAACPKFSNAAVAVDNATKAHFLAQAGKGDKQLTGLGEDLVEALPDQEKVKAIVSKNRPRKKHQKTKK